MKVLLFGATGGTGQHVLAQALAQGHQVTAFVRDPARLTASPQRVVTGDVTEDTAGVAAAMRGQDAVISALGKGQSLKSGNLIVRSVRTIVPAMEAAGVRRLIFTSGFGLGDTYRDIPLLAKIFMRTMLRNLYADKAAAEEIIRGSTLVWTLVYPSGLTNGPRTGRYRAGEHLELHGMPRVARADVADFILKQLTDATYVRKGALVSS